MWCAGDAVWSHGARRQRVVRAEDIHSVADNGKICPLLQPHWRWHRGHHHETAVCHSRIWRQSVALSSLSSHHFGSDEGSSPSSWCNVTISVVVTFFSSQFQSKISICQNVCTALKITKIFPALIIRTFVIFLKIVLVL